MSLTNKVIKNTYYNFLSQIINFIAPLILTPFIIYKIGNTEFGIYAFIIGVSGIFALFDLSISTSFYKFVSEYYNQKKYFELNSVINTASIFYLVFSLICVAIAYILKDYFLAAINIPAEYESKALFTYFIGLLAFSAVNTFGIFNSIIVSLQKMYVTSLYGIVLSVLNFIAVITLLVLGYGLYGILISHIFFITCSLLISMYYSFKFIPEIRVGIKYFRWKTLKDMFNIGAQMQISKLASFASDKYDEFLLAYFSVIGNVTYFNIASRVARVGKIVPTQLFTQAAPVAAELNAKNQPEQLQSLYVDTTKYLSIVTFPIFMFMILFAEEMIHVWIGPGYEISAYLLRIIAVGSVINLLLSAPGNSITPHIGLPKFSMYEGLIFLSINIILSYLLVKYYGIIGAAYGSTISTAIAAVYVFIASVKFFKQSRFEIIKKIFTKPFLAGMISSVITYLIYYAVTLFYSSGGRIENGIFIAVLFMIFAIVYTIIITVTKYLGKKEFLIFAKALLFFPPVKKYILKRLGRTGKQNALAEYNNELISIFIVTYNRLDFLKKCINSLLKTVDGIKYELIIWDNGSNDGTKEYLNAIVHPAMKIHFSEKNIGTNAKHYAAEMCKGDYIVGIDDDVIDFPNGWLLNLIEAYKNIPRIGYLSTDVVQDEKTQGAKPGEENYYNVSFNNGKFIFQNGPAGGWTFLISREVYNRTGKFILDENNIFIGEDGNYTMRVIEKGLRAGILKDIKVYHSTDIENNRQYMNIYDAKMSSLDKQKSGAFKKIQSFIRHRKYYYYKFIGLLEKEALIMEGHT